MEGTENNAGGSMGISTRIDIGPAQSAKPHARLGPVLIHLTGTTVQQANLNIYRTRSK